MPKAESSLLPAIGRLAARRGGGAPPAAAGTIPLATAGRVELCGRALLPPGVDDLVLSIFDDEPTSIIAYFLATRSAGVECSNRRGSIFSCAPPIEHQPYGLETQRLFCRGI